VTGAERLDAEMEDVPQQRFQQHCFFFLCSSPLLSGMLEQWITAEAAFQCRKRHCWSTEASSSVQHVFSIWVVSLFRHFVRTANALRSKRCPSSGKMSCQFCVGVPQGLGQGGKVVLLETNSADVDLIHKVAGDQQH